MRHKFTFIFLSVILLSCNTEPPKETAQDEQAIIAPTGISNELKAQYEQYYQAIEKPFPTTCIAELNKVNPADAAPLDTVFFVFREQLKEIVAEKNIFKLLKHVDQNIKIGFGAENGLQAFIVAWDLSSEEKIPDSELWPTLADVLNLGGLFNGQGNYFEAPYLDQCYPHDKDAFETGAVIGAGVRMRAGPNLDTKVLKNLSYDILDYIETTPIELKIGNETHPWIKVKTQDGIEGFIYGKFYRSPIDYRVGFEKKPNGEWKIVSLLAGD